MTPCHCSNIVDLEIASLQANFKVKKGKHARRDQRDAVGISTLSKTHKQKLGMNIKNINWQLPRRAGLGSWKKR